MSKLATRWLSGGVPFGNELIRPFVDWELLPWSVLSPTKGFELLMLKGYNLYEGNRNLSS